MLSGIQLSLSSYLVSYLTQEMALTALVAGSLLGLSQLGGVVGRIVWGFLSDGLVRPLVMLGTLAAGDCAGSSLTTGRSGAVACGAPERLLAALMFVFGATASGWNGVYLAEVARQAPPGTAGKATSGTLALTFLGVIVGAPLFGLIAASPAGFRRRVQPAGGAGAGRGGAAVHLRHAPGDPAWMPARIRETPKA